MDDDAPGGAPERVRDLVTWRLSVVHARAHRLLTEALAQDGFTGRRYRLLAALVEAGPTSQADLGRRAGLDRSDVVEAVDALAGRGLLVRAPDPLDRRRNVVTATAEGVRLLARLDANVAAVQDDLLAALPARDRASFERLLGLLSAADPSGRAGS